MLKLSNAEKDMLNVQLPGNQITRLGTREYTNENYGTLVIQKTIAAGAVGIVTPITLDSDPEVNFDFEVLDVTVRTESAVASSTVQLKKGTSVISDAIVSAVDKALTRAGSLDKTYTKFYPASDPSGYASSPLNLVDAGGATAAARTVFIFVKRI